MYPSDEIPKINDYGAISLGLVTKPSEKRLSNKEITEKYELCININKQIKVKGKRLIKRKIKT
jgi:hypothetical protein